MSLSTFIILVLGNFVNDDTSIVQLHSV